MTNEEAVKYLTINKTTGQVMYKYTNYYYPPYLIDLFANDMVDVVLNREDFVGIVSHPTLLPYTNGNLVKMGGRIQVEVFGITLMYEGEMNAH